MSTDGLLLGWQLVVLSLSLCIFAKNPKPQKGMSSKNPRIPKVETSKIESNRIASHQIDQQQGISSLSYPEPVIGSKKCLPLYVPYPYQVYVRCGFQGLRTRFDVQYLVTTYGLHLT